MDATILDVNSFYNQFPRLKAKFSEDRIAYWHGQFQSLYEKKQWGQFWARGANLYAAHNLVIEDTINDSEDAFTIANGQATVVHKEVGPLYKTMSYSGKHTALVNQGQWGLTLYGQQFFQLIRMIGVGGRLIGPSSNKENQQILI